MPRKIVDHGAVKGVVRIDLNEGRYHRMSAVGQLTVKMSEFPPRGEFTESYLEIIGADKFTITMPGKIVWPGKNQGLTGDGSFLFKVSSPDSGKTVWVHHVATENAA